MRENKSLSVIVSVIVIGDSELIIKGLCKVIKISQSILQGIYHGITTKEQNFQSVDYFHIF